MEMEGEKSIYDVEKLRKDEFSRLDRSGEVFLDHAGTALYSEKQLRDATIDITSNSFGNPHSKGPASRRTLDRVREAKELVLKHFNTNEKEYAVIFTSGATEALKIVGESFRWNSEDGSFRYLAESHNSLVGIREYAIEAKVRVDAVTSWKEFAEFYDTHSSSSNHLVAFPGECNFSGLKFDLSLIEKIHKANPRNYVLLDAAKFVATDVLDLSKWKPDFVSMSFYKIFGYPTGLGALLVKRRSASEALRRRNYFGGGTVLVATPVPVTHKDRHDFLTIRKDSIEDSFEDGTSHFMGAIALRHGFQLIKRLGGMKSIREHTKRISTLCVRMLRSLRMFSHALFFLPSLYISLITYPLELQYQLQHQLKQTDHDNGNAVVNVYGWKNENDHGPVIAFNVKDRDGTFVGYASVERVLSSNKIQARSGCFCNPGACMKWLGQSEKDVVDMYTKGHVCGDDVDLVGGQPTGALRVSFGFESTKKDVHIFVRVLERYFCTSSFSSSSSKEKKSNHKKLVVSSLHVYPIKSCGSMTPLKWPIDRSGLWCDRKWVLLDPKRKFRIITQKKCPKMYQIIPQLVLSCSRTSRSRCEVPQITLTAPTFKPITIPCSCTSNFFKEDQESYVPVLVCGKVRGKAYIVKNNDISKWLESVLERPAVLAVQVPITSEENVEDEKTTTATCSTFANEGSLLLVSETSVNDLSQRLVKNGCSRVSPESFRPNLCIRGGIAFQEDTWTGFQVNDDLKFSAGERCKRCAMVNISQSTGQKQPETLAIMSLYRREKGNVYFGRYVRLEKSRGSSDEIAVGMNLCPE